MMPLESVVLPLPRSPESNTRRGGARRCASARPNAMVSSGSERRILSVWHGRTPREAAQTPLGALRSGRRPPGALPRPAPRPSRPPIRAGRCPRAEDALPVLGAELGGQARQHAGQHVAGAARGHSGIASGVDEGAAIGHSQNCVVSLEDDMGAPASPPFRGPHRGGGLARRPQWTRADEPSRRDAA